MSNFFERIFGRDRKSASHAKERLKLVLIHDRTDMSPATMETLKDELINVISRYVDIDPQAVQIDVAQDGREQRLVADIPIRSAGRRKVR